MIVFTAVKENNLLSDKWAGGPGDFLSRKLLIIFHFFSLKVVFQREQLGLQTVNEFQFSEEDGLHKRVQLFNLISAQDYSMSLWDTELQGGRDPFILSWREREKGISN